MNRPQFINSDATSLPFADKTFALTMTSPPYMDARTYGINAHRNCETWIEWMLGIVRECVRVTTGPVIVNCGGVTRERNYWPGCEGLLYRAWQAGVESYRPAFWHRVGIPGSGGKDWLRADVEYCLCFKNPGPLPYFDVSAIGHTPKCNPGGAMSYRLPSGDRVNGTSTQIKQALREAGVKVGGRQSRTVDGERIYRTYVPPEKSNPGNILMGIRVGGGLMGHPLAHENEAPFPEGLPEFFIKGWTRPGDIVLDPFSGSGTTACVANRLGRFGVGCDLRMSQCKFGEQRWDTPYAKRTKAKTSATSDAFGGLFGSDA